MHCTRAIARQGTSAVAFVAQPPEDDDPLLAFAPYVHEQPRRNSITPEVQRRFVAQLAATGIVKQAARHVGRSLEALYKLRHKPGAEGFAAAWDAALERGVRRLEDVAIERARMGTPMPIVSGGKLLGWYDKPDNNLLRFLLQHRLPQSYGRDGDVGPGHPVYERVRRAYADDERKRHNDPVEIARIQASIERKFNVEVRRAVEDIIDKRAAEIRAEAERRAAPPLDPAPAEAREPVPSSCSLHRVKESAHDPSTD